MIPIHRHRTSDDGSVMVIVLAFIIVIGLVTVAILNQTTTNLRASSVTSEVNARIYAASSGVDLAVQNVRRDPSSCNGGQVGGSLTIDGRTITATCQVVGGSLAGVSGRAIHVAGTAAGIVANSSGSSLVVGGVYLDGSLAQASGGQMQISSGNVQREAATCPNPVLPAWVNFSGGPIFTASCSAAVAAPTPPLPPFDPAWATPQNPAGTASGSCRVFSPGRYTSPPQLTANSYFQSGVYYFDFDGVIDVPFGSSVVGGRPANGETSQLGIVLPCVLSGASNGVQWLFGRGSRLAFGEGSFGILQDSKIELYTLTDAGSGAAFPTLQQVTTSGGGYTASTLSPASSMPSAGTTTRSLLSVRTGFIGGNGVAIHGMVHGPNAQVDVSSTGGFIVGGGTINLLGGVTTRQLFVGPLATISSGAVVSGVTGTGLATVRITATDVLAGCGTGGNPKCISVIADITFDNNAATRRPVITSWTVVNP